VWSLQLQQAGACCCSVAKTSRFWLLALSKRLSAFSLRPEECGEVALEGKQVGDGDGDGIE
jgi:hypothetical protein